MKRADGQGGKHERSPRACFLCAILQDEQTMYAYEGAFSDEEVQEWLDRQRARYREYGFGFWAAVGKERGKSTDTSRLA